MKSLRRSLFILIISFLVSLTVIAQQEPLVDNRFGEKINGDGWSDVETDDGIDYRWMTETSTTLNISLEPQPLTLEFRILGAFVDVSIIDTLQVTFNEELLLLTRTDEENLSSLGQPAIIFRADIEEALVPDEGLSTITFSVDELGSTAGLELGLAFQWVQIYPRTEIVLSECNTYQTEVIELVENICTNTRRNEICYGNANIDAEPQPDASNWTFNQPGDIVNVSTLQSLRLSSMSLDDNIWGITQLRVQADLPDESQQDANILLFGNVNFVSDFREYPDGISAIVNAGADVLNVRSSPTVSGDIVARLNTDEQVRVFDGPVESDGFTWWQLRMPNGNTGWAVDNDGDEQTLYFVDLGILAPNGRAFVYTTDGDVLNMRSGAGTANGRVARLPRETPLAVIGGPVEADGFTWWNLRVLEAQVDPDGVRIDEGQEGWAVDFVDNEPTLLVPVRGPRFGPIQAFSFESFGDESPCEDFQDSGIIIQTPEGVGRINFLVNEVDIALGSTIYVRAQADDLLRLDVLEGEASVQSAGVEQFVPRGGYTTVRLDADGDAFGPPQFPEPYDLSDLDSLPIGGLARGIEIANPFNPNPTIQRVVAPSDGEVPADGTYYYGEIFFENVDGDDLAEVIYNLVSAPEGANWQNVNRLLDITLLSGNLREGSIEVGVRCGNSPIDGENIFDIEIVDVNDNRSEPVRMVIECIEA